MRVAIAPDGSNHDGFISSSVATMDSMRHKFVSATRISGYYELPTNKLLCDKGKNKRIEAVDIDNCLAAQRCNRSSARSTGLPMSSEKRRKAVSSIDVSSSMDLAFRACVALGAATIGGLTSARRARMSFSRSTNALWLC